eukprot:2261038-Amphidinium_carterae.1
MNKKTKVAKPEKGKSTKGQRKHEHIKVDVRKFYGFCLGRVVLGTIRTEEYNHPGPKRSKNSPDQKLKIPLKKQTYHHKNIEIQSRLI